jgi:holo-[acyl-carrier protein] synthase
MSLVVGIGIDIVEVRALEAALQRTPGLGPRLFVPSELCRSVESMAGCFAAKEALAKALGGGDLPWGDVEVISLTSGQPTLRLTGDIAARARVLGVARSHLSITHDSGLAAAVVLLEGAVRERRRPLLKLRRQ